MLEYNFEKFIFKGMTYVDCYCNNIWNLTGKMLCSQQCCGRTPLHNCLCEQITFCFQGFPITRQVWLQVEHVMTMEFNIWESKQYGNIRLMKKISIFFPDTIF